MQIVIASAGSGGGGVYVEVMWNDGPTWTSLVRIRLVSQVVEMRPGYEITVVKMSGFAERKPGPTPPETCEWQVPQSARSSGFT
jgi:hypothetical protein